MYEQLSELQGMYNSILADQNSGIDENSEAAYAMRKTLEDIAESISEKYVEIFNGINDLYQEQLNIADFYMTGVENRLAAAETKGYLISSNYYKAMGDIQKKNISTLNNELKDLEKAMENALNSGRVQKYSVEWFSMNTAINDTKTAIDEANNSLLEYEKTMRELDWSHFEFLQDRISQITQEADFLIDLMSEEQLFEDNGQFTKQGQATNGLHAVNYDTYMNQADRYRQEVEKLNKELAKDPYNTDVLLHREEMLKLQRDSISAAQKEKQAIKDLVENGIKKELEALKELIDTYKEGLNADKDQYAFEKNISEQTKNIATLEKRLSAMQGDNSEESKAQIQRLKTDLDEANQKLAETQMDHVITETQKMLDDLYLSYEEILNERLDNIDALVSDMIVMANENASLISGTITTEALNVGYHIEASLMDIWTGSGGIREVVSYYGEGFLGRLNSVNIAIDAIDAKVKDYIAHTANGGIETYAASALSVLNTISTQLGNIGAKADTSKAASSASSSTATKKSTPAPSTTTTKPAQTGGTLTNDIAMHVAAAIWNGNYGWDNWPGREAKLNEVFGPNGWNTIQPLVDRGYAYSAGYSPVGFSYADMRKKFKGYKTGGLNDYTGLAMLHGTPEKPELVLDAADTKNFIALKDVLSTNAMPSILKDIARMPKLNGIGGFGSNSNTINGGINVQVVSPQDYDDFLNQMRDDKNFEKLVQAMTTDRLVGRSSMKKNGYRW